MEHVIIIISTLRRHYKINDIATYLFIAFKNGAFKRVAISCNITKYFEIAAIMGYVKYSIDGVVHYFYFVCIIRPIFFL